MMLEAIDLPTTFCWSRATSSGRIVDSDELVEPDSTVSSASDCHSGGLEFAPLPSYTTFVEIGHEIFSTAIQIGQ